MGAVVERVVRAFAPGNISGVFKVIPHDDPRKMHSLGMGLTVSEGATVAISRAAEVSISFNGEAIEFPTVACVVDKLSAGPVRVEIESPLPLSGGFGLSGASSLAAAYGLNELFSLEHSPEELAMTAHVAEVENLTGLGDVCAQFHGGCLVKLTSGEPLAAERLAVEGQSIYYRHFGPISTREVLSDAEARDRINRAADRALEQLGVFSERDRVDFDACIEVCKTFAVDSELLRDDSVIRTIDEIEAAGGSASMIMLGNAVFSTLSFAGASSSALSQKKARLL